MFKFTREFFTVPSTEESAPLLSEDARPLLVHTLDGAPVDVDLSRAHSVAEAREHVACALGVDSESHLGVKLLSGGCDVCDGASLDSLDRDLGLTVVLAPGAPDWYPRDKYIHDDQEVLQITMADEQYFAEFVNGSSQQVDRELYQKALQDWGWQEVSLENRLWAHPPEKPKESGGWTDFMANVKSVMTSRNAARGVGAVAGFLAGVTGNLDVGGPCGGTDFGTAFQVAQCVGLVIYGGSCIVHALRK